MNRDSIEAKRSPASESWQDETGSEGWQVKADEEDMYCVQFDRFRFAYCYDFTDDTCWGYTHLDLHDSKEDALKEVITASREWGEPIRYFADFTEVSSIDQAILLADPVAKVVFPSIDGVGMVWSFYTEPKEDAGDLGGRYTSTTRYVGLKYLGDVNAVNYWR
jgi:hypothetical protein